MAKIIVSWIAQDEPVAGAEAINHFGIKLTDAAGAVIDDASEPLTSRSHTFLDVPPGDYFVTAQSFNADESASSAAPLTQPVSVVAEATAPVVVSLTANVG
jgi:hypothetical protein